MSTVCISLCPTSLIIFNMVGDTLSDLEAEEYEIESKVSSEGSEDTLKGKYKIWKEKRNDVHERSWIFNDEEKIDSWNREEEKRWKRDKIEKKKRNRKKLKRIRSKGGNN